MLSYRFDDLGWQQFESLCHALLRKIFGPLLEAWGGSSDQGRDAYWPSIESHSMLAPGSGPAIFQAKFIEGANAAGSKPGRGLLRAIATECAQIVERRRKSTLGDVRTYILITNAPLSPRLRQQAQSSLLSVLPGCTVACWGAAELRAMLADASDIRAAFPQLLDLSDLQKLLADAVNTGPIQRSRLCLERAVELLPIFVPTQAYHRALQLLERHHFVVLQGPPEMGKSTVARIVGLMKSHDGWEYQECRNPDEFFKLRQPSRRQVFIVDDAFGSTEYKPELASAWGNDLDAVLRSAGSDCWLIWTSRSAPLIEALSQMNLQGRAEQFPAPAEVVVDAGELSLEERAHIIFKHAVTAKLPSVIKHVFRNLALQAVEDEHFTPLRARNWVERIKSHDWERVAEEMPAVLQTFYKEEIQHPTDRMTRSFEALSVPHRQLLISLLDTYGETSLEGDIISAFHQIFPETEGGIEQRLRELEGHFLRGFMAHVMTEDSGCLAERGYRWVHPSWRDLVIRHLSASSQLRRQFLSRCSAPGSMLALSFAGGEIGERQQPLLRDGTDWQCLRKNVIQLIPRLDSSETEHLLQSVYSVLKKGKHSVSPLTHQEVLTLARAALETCRCAWAGRLLSPTLSMLDLYYRISEFLSPLPGGPELNECWENHINNVNQSLGRSDRDAIISSVDGWLALVELLQENEPRFLRQVEFPDNYQDTLNRLTTWVRTLRSTWDGGAHDEYESQALLRDAMSVREFVQCVMEASLTLNEDLCEELEALDSLLASQIRRHEARLKALPSRMYQGEVQERPQRTESSNPFNVWSLFSKL
jgi:hypothetical protein